MALYTITPNNHWIWNGYATPRTTQVRPYGIYQPRPIAFKNGKRFPAYLLFTKTKAKRICNQSLCVNPEHYKIINSISSDQEELLDYLRSECMDGNTFEFCDLYTKEDYEVVFMLDPKLKEWACPST